MSPRRIRVTASVVVPRTPSFLRFEDQEMHSIPIQSMSDKGLAEIGRLWTEDLIERAQLLRSLPDE